MSRHLARATALLLTLTSPVLLHAQENAPAAAGANLTLEECIARAMQKNFDLQVQNLSTEIAKESLNAANADFDPSFTATTRRNLNQSARRHLRQRPP